MTTKSMLAGVAWLCMYSGFAGAVAAVASDPTDLTQSSYANPVRGDVIEWVQPSEWHVIQPEFDEGSAVLRPAVRASLLSVLQRAGVRIDVEIVGRPDPGGATRLGVARALALRRVALAAGIPPSRIRSGPEGARGPSGAAALEVPEDDSREAVSAIRWLAKSEAVSRPYPVEPAQTAGAADHAAARGESPGRLAPAAALAPTASAVGSQPLSIQPEDWEVRTQDVTLERTLMRWASLAGYRLQWDAQRNFLIAAPDHYRGTFESAVQAVLGSAGIRHGDYPLEACIYANQPPLVRITRLGEQARECTPE